ncbi:MAG: oxalate:formate antiporter [Candidatus Velthaea sp.]|jgi:hypothetical protein
MEQSKPGAGEPATAVKLVAAWVFVGIPLAWGFLNTAVSASALFK